jgi:predicted dithiol-disulfide oxidoreductase (DUF899 family)
MRSEHAKSGLRRELLAAEKELTRRSDEVARQRKH